MLTNLQPGRYVVAVSGGVDSVALLHLLTQQPDLRLIVAHFDHGIRGESTEDRKFVQALAKEHGLPFTYDEGKLGAGASEASARDARYKFLHAVRESADAEAIITAHHQDDVIETALLNLMRGTGRKGATSLRSTDIVKRPLVHVPKQRLISYAQANGLKWREDRTNTDLRYKRNFVRHQVVSKLTPLQRQQLLARLRHLHRLDRQIEQRVINHLHMQPGLMVLDRRYFIMLPHSVALEVLAAWLRRSGTRDFDRKGLHRIVVAAKTFASTREIDVNYRYLITVRKKTLALKTRDR